MMSRRTPPKKKIDELAFPVRILIRNRCDGSGIPVDEVRDWLNIQLGAGEYAMHSAKGVASNPIGFYFRDLQCATALLQAFPQLELEDGTQSITYSTPIHWAGSEIFGVCNLYSQTKGQSAILEVTKAMVDETGNMPPLTGIFPNTMAPVVRNNNGRRELSMLRWGMPTPAFALKNRNTDPGITNVRNTTSPHWRRWLNVENRCVVPFTSFCEYDVRPGKNKEPNWFALNESRPLAFFAGIWTNWTSVRKVKDGETNDNLFAFLTTDANDVVAPIHPKAMPVILQTEDEIDRWLNRPVEEALTMQRPLPDGALEVVAKGERQDASVIET